ncbi:hypothetical protein KEM55_007762 [Ascosphaera atra]|nr:hypothetical protein KEM55_007762 [Ascosphaera atra]
MVVHVHIVIVLDRRPARPQTNILIHKIRDPKHSIPLLRLNRVNIKPRRLGMQPNTMRQPYRRRDQKERKLRIRRPLQEKRHSQQRLHTQQVRIAHRQLREDAHGVLEVEPRLLVLALRDGVGDDAQAVGEGEGDVDAGPPAAALVGVARVLAVDEVHEGWLVEEGHQAVEVLEEVAEEGDGFVAGWEGLEDAAPNRT